MDLQTFTKYYTENSVPPHDGNFDYGFMHKLSDFIEKCYAEIPPCHNAFINEVMNAPMTLTELKQAIGRAKNGKSGGIDGIPIEFIKYGTGTIHNAILALFNYIFDHGQYPDLRSRGIVNPVYKTGSMCSPENYRKITLISALGKIFDSILNNRMHFCKEDLWVDNVWQNGFKPGSHTTDNSFIFNAVIDNYTALKRPLFVCYVDFKSAFDFINRHTLLFKLITNGFTGKVFTILRDLFSKSKSRVKWDSVLGEYFDNFYGVLQGGVISPTLFNTFIDDMQKMFHGIDGVSMGNMKINHLLQADDLVLISETSTGLQRLLNRLETYCHRWHLILNTTKTKIMIFNKMYCVCQDINAFIYDKRQITECDKYKYLGVIISNKKMRFKENFQYLKEKSTRACISADVYVRSAVGNELPFRLQLKLFDQQIRPIIEYASNIWCPDAPVEELERVQLKFLKRALGVSLSTPTLAVYGETGRFPLHLRQQDQMLKLWLRIQRMPDDSIMKQIYRELLALSNDGHDNWANWVNSLFVKFNVLRADLDSISPNDLDKFLSNFRETRYRKFMIDWLRELNGLSSNCKLRTYRIFKTDFCLEPHLLYMQNKKHQRAMTRLWVSSHKLQIEAGRHSLPTVPIGDQLCTYCEQNVIDDENNFMMACNFHDAERGKSFCDN